MVVLINFLIVPFIDIYTLLRLDLTEDFKELAEFKPEAFAPAHLKNITSHFQEKLSKEMSPEQIQNAWNLH